MVQRERDRQAGRTDCGTDESAKFSPRGLSSGLHARSRMIPEDQPHRGEDWAERIPPEHDAAEEAQADRCGRPFRQRLAR